jgi:hypothetical protein
MIITTLIIIIVFRIQLTVSKYRLFWIIHLLPEVNKLFLSMNTDWKSNLKWLVVPAAVILLSYAVISFGTPKYDKLYREEKISRENLQEYVLKLTGENQRLKADLQGGRTASEEREALGIREKEITRRERLLDKREDDLEYRIKDFNSTVRTTGEDVGQATQIQKDYEDSKQLLNEVLKARGLWQTLCVILVILVITFLVIAIAVFLYIRKLQYLKGNLEKVIEVLRSKFENPSVSVEEVKGVVETFTQLNESAKTPKMLNPGSELW